MEFIDGVCPHCSGVLKLPVDRETVICMYCGGSVTIDLAGDVGREDDVVEKRDCHIYVKRSLENFPAMLLAIKDPLKDFRKVLYEKKFQEYQNAHLDTMNSIEEAFLMLEGSNDFIVNLAEVMVHQAQALITATHNKRKQMEILTNFNLSIVVYVNPALQMNNIRSGKAVAMELIRQWKVQFPETNLKLSDFEGIQSGFRRRFCYITTAVCESLGKTDDCYELTLLRNYRDHFLMSQTDGADLIHRYYDVAPTIVRRMARDQDCLVIYRKIWNEYLYPCIQMIENNKPDVCLVLYTRMMRELERTYFKQEDC